MTRFMSHLLTACIGFIGIAGCGAPEDPPEPVATPEMTKAMPEKIEVEILNISEEFANINTSITREELAEKGIVENSWITVTYKDKSYPMLMGKDYGDVARGKWIARIDEEDDRLQLAISFGNAANDMGCTVGDKLLLQLSEAPSLENATTQPAG